MVRCAGDAEERLAVLQGRLNNGSISGECPQVGPTDLSTGRFDRPVRQAGSPGQAAEQSVRSCRQIETSRLRTDGMQAEADVTDVGVANAEAPR